MILDTNLIYKQPVHLIEGSDDKMSLSLTCCSRAVHLGTLLACCIDPKIHNRVHSTTNRANKADTKATVNSMCHSWTNTNHLAPMSDRLAIMANLSL